MSDPLPSTARVERALALSLWDVVAYALMVGLGEAYILADAVRLQGSALELGLVLSLPLCIGGVGPLAAGRLLQRLRARKPLVVGGALGQTLALAAMAAMNATDVLTPRLLIGLAALHQAFGQAAGSAWSSWYGDLVPAAMRGRWFARRNRRAHLSTAIGILLAGLLLWKLEPGSAFEAGARSGAGFTTIFSLAAACRAVSAALLLASPEPRFGGLPGRLRVFRFLRTERGTSAWRLVLFVALLQLSVYVAAPYFQPYMLEELRFSYLELMTASIAVTAFKVTLLPLWGAGIDRQGARPVCTAAAILIAIVPLPWLWARGLGVVLFAECLSGIAWAGFEVAQFSLFLEATYRRTRLAVFAAQSLANGVAQLLGTLVGAGVIAMVGDARGVFAVSIFGRLVAALCILRFLPIPARLRTVEARHLLLRVIGFRPNSGVVHRPIDVDLPAPGAERERQPPSPSSGGARSPSATSSS